MRIPFLRSWFRNESETLKRVRARQAERQQEMSLRGPESDLDYTRVGTRSSVGSGLTNRAVHGLLVRDEVPFEHRRSLSGSVKSVLFGVSMAVAGFVGGSYLERGKADAQAEWLQTTISKLESDVRRLAARQIDVPSDSRIVPIATISGTLEYVEFLRARVAELESVQKTGKTVFAAPAPAPAPAPATSSSDRSKPIVHPAPEFFATQNAALSRFDAMVREAAPQLPTGVTVRAAISGMEVRIVYRDEYGLNRYFTTGRPENRSKETVAGIVKWANTHYIASIDALVARENRSGNVTQLRPSF